MAPSQPYRPFDSRVINLSDYCDVIKEQLDEVRVLGGCDELEYYNVEFKKLTELFEREKK